jgi:hypothetical protein
LTQQPTGTRPPCRRALFFASRYQEILPQEVGLRSMTCRSAWVMGRNEHSGLDLLRYSLYRTGLAAYLWNPCSREMVHDPVLALESHVVRLSPPSSRYRPLPIAFIL